MEIVELAPHVGRARSFLDASVSIEMMEARIAIGLQRAAEVAQMLARMFSLAIGRVGKPYGGSCLYRRRRN